MQFSVDDDQAGWILSGLKLLIAANVDTAKFEAIKAIAEFGKQFEDYLNEVVRNGIKERKSPPPLGRT